MLLLASASPRRRELLAEAGVDVVVEPAHIDEAARPGEAPDPFARRTAAEKAAAVAARHTGEEAWVLGADTVVALDGDILGKPSDSTDAARMLRMLSGRAHQVITGVALHPCGDGVAEAWSVTTEVAFRALTPTEIDAYVATGEPMDKAGAYALQGGAAEWVRQLDGSYTNVVGLPVDEVMARWRVLG